MTDVKIIYLKQVSGYLPYLSNKGCIQKNLVDPVDGCFSVGLCTPEVFSIPHGHTRMTNTNKFLDMNYPHQEHFTLPKGGKKRKSGAKGENLPDNDLNINHADHEYEKHAADFNAVVLNKGQVNYVSPKNLPNWQ